MNETLLSQFDALETQLVEIYKTICAEIAQTAFDERGPLYDRLVTVKGLLHNVREILRQAAPELYRDF